MSLTFEDVKRAVKEALKESGGGFEISPPVDNDLVMRADGAVYVPELAAMKRKFEAEGTKEAAIFAQYIPEYVFCEEAITGKLFPDVNTEQYTNISYNTNRALMTAGFLDAKDYTGLSSTWGKRWPWSNYEPIKAVPDAASVPGSNGTLAASVKFDDLGGIFLRLFDRYKATGHLPLWKQTELVYPK